MAKKFCAIYQRIENQMNYLNFGKLYTHFQQIIRVTQKKENVLLFAHMQTAHAIHFAIEFDFIIVFNIPQFLPSPHAFTLFSSVLVFSVRYNSALRYNDSQPKSRQCRTLTYKQKKLNRKRVIRCAAMHLIGTGPANISQLQLCAESALQTGTWSRTGFNKSSKRFELFWRHQKNGEFPVRA